MKKIYLAGLCVCIYSISNAQQNTVSSGGDASGSGGTVSYSVGQIDYLNTTGTNGNINQGVQQPFEFYTLDLNEVLLIDVNLYPNPTNEFIILQFENFKIGHSYSLIDVNGKTVSNGRIEATETQIDMRLYATGQYQLLIQDGSRIAHSIKIIKN